MSNTSPITRKRVLNWVKEALFWIFGVVTCTYFVLQAIWESGRQSPLVFALLAPLLLIPLANAAALLILDGEKKPGRLSMAMLGSLNSGALVVSRVYFGLFFCHCRLWLYSS